MFYFSKITTMKLVPFCFYLIVLGPFRDKSWRKDSIWFSHKKSLVHCIVHEKNQSIDLMEKQQCFFGER